MEQLQKLLHFHSMTRIHRNKGHQAIRGREGIAEVLGESPHSTLTYSTVGRGNTNTRVFSLSQYTRLVTSAIP